MKMKGADFFFGLGIDKCSRLNYLVDAGAKNVLTITSTSNLTTNTFTAGQGYTLFVYGEPGNSAQPLSATWVVDQASP